MNKQKTKIQIVTMTAFVIALRLVLEMIPSFNIGNLAQIGVGFIGAAFAGILLGPWKAASVGFFVDILGTVLRGTIFFPGYTLTAIVGGLLYGYFLYQKPLTWKRIALCVLAVTMICNLLLNSVWVYLMTGKAFATFMGIRILKNIISFPLNTLLLGLIVQNQTMKELIDKYRI